MLLHVSSFQKERLIIKLKHVTEMNVFHFWVGSVILDVSLLPKQAVSHAEWEGLFAGSIHEAYIQAAIDCVKNPFLFVLAATYGADVHAACDEMNIDRR